MRQAAVCQEGMDRQSCSRSPAVYVAPTVSTSQLHLGPTTNLQPVTSNLTSPPSQVQPSTSNPKPFTSMPPTSNIPPLTSNIHQDPCSPIRIPENASLKSTRFQKIQTTMTQACTMRSSSAPGQGIAEICTRPEKKPTLGLAWWGALAARGFFKEQWVKGPTEKTTPKGLKNPLDKGVPHTLTIHSQSTASDRTQVYQSESPKTSMTSPNPPNPPQPSPKLLI